MRPILCTLCPSHTSASKSTPSLKHTCTRLEYAWSIAWYIAETSWIQTWPENCQYSPSKWLSNIYIYILHVSSESDIITSKKTMQEDNNEEDNSPWYTRIWILSLLKRLNTLLFISAKLFDTNKANKALLWATIQVDNVMAWANKRNEWTSRNS